MNLTTRAEMPCCRRSHGRKDDVSGVIIDCLEQFNHMCGDQLPSRLHVVGANLLGQAVSELFKTIRNRLKVPFWFEKTSWGWVTYAARPLWGGCWVFQQDTWHLFWLLWRVIYDTYKKCHLVHSCVPECTSLRCLKSIIKIYYFSKCQRDPVC